MQGCRKLPPCTDGQVKRKDKYGKICCYASKKTQKITCPEGFVVAPSRGKLSCMKLPSSKSAQLKRVQELINRFPFQDKSVYAKTLRKLLKDLSETCDGPNEVSSFTKQGKKKCYKLPKNRKARLVKLETLAARFPGGPPPSLLVRMDTLRKKIQSPKPKTPSVNDMFSFQYHAISPTGEYIPSWDQHIPRKIPSPSLRKTAPAARKAPPKISEPRIPGSFLDNVIDKMSKPAQVRKPKRKPLFIRVGNAPPTRHPYNNHVMEVYTSFPGYVDFEEGPEWNSKANHERKIKKAQNKWGSWSLLHAASSQEKLNAKRRRAKIIS